MHRAVTHALLDFQEKYNDHNVPGVRGGRPVIRRKYRTRAAHAPPPTHFDTNTDWVREFAKSQPHRAHQLKKHFVEEFTHKILGLAQLPSGQRIWQSIKESAGEGEFRAAFGLARAAAAKFTAASIAEAEAKSLREHKQ